MVSTDHEVAATQPSGASIAGSLVAFAWKATGILHDIRALAGQAGRQPRARPPDRRRGRRALPAS